jgi:hypothetical protein
VPRNEALVRLIIDSRRHLSSSQNSQHLKQISCATTHFCKELQDFQDTKKKSEELMESAELAAYIGQSYTSFPRARSVTWLQISNDASRPFAIKPL